MKENGAMAGERLPDRLGPASAIDNLSYAQELRALGQDLEAYKLLSVDLQMDEGLYVVRGIARVSTGSLFARLLRVFSHNSSSALGQRHSTSEIELRYSLRDIEQLESRGRAKRKEPHHMPDPYSLSQVLRGAGSYLDNRAGTHLVEITVKDQWITLQYETPRGWLECDRQDVEYFYNYWVKMYLRRRDRPKLPPASDPTLMMEWDDILKRLSLTPSRFSNFS